MIEQMPEAPKDLDKQLEIDEHLVRQEPLREKQDEALRKNTKSRDKMMKAAFEGDDKGIAEALPDVVESQIEYEKTDRKIRDNIRRFLGLDVKEEAKPVIPEGIEEEEEEEEEEVEEPSSGTSQE